MLRKLAELAITFVNHFQFIKSKNYTLANCYYAYSVPLVFFTDSIQF